MPENWFDPGPAEQRVFERSVKAVAINAEVTLGDAQRNAPVETGYLRGSGHVEMKDYAWSGAMPDVIEAVIRFDAAYAAVQEVNEEYDHPMGGKAHFLGDSVKTHGPELLATLQAVVRSLGR